MDCACNQYPCQGGSTDACARRPRYHLREIVLVVEQEFLSGIKEMMYLRHVIGKGLNIHSSVAERKTESSPSISSLKFSSSSFVRNAWARL